MKYYRLLDDLSIEERWFLGEINFKTNNDIWEYIKAGSIDNPQIDLKVPIAQKGKPLDITMGEFEILLINERASNIFDDGQVQKIPVVVKGYEHEPYCILIVRYEIDCIDKENSEFELWEENNSLRPDLAGTYRMIYKIVINPAVMQNFDIIRIKGFNVAIIVSEKIKVLFERNNFTGVKFKQV